MAEQKRINQIIPSLIFVFILLAGTGLFFWKAGFFSRENTLACNKSNAQLCVSEETCISNGFYWWDSSCHIDKKVNPALSEYPDFSSLAEMKSLALIENFNSYTPEGKVLNSSEIKGIILKDGQISKGYLEIIASINNKPLTIWESVYFKAPYNVLDHYKYGGNIFRPESLKVPPSDKTHLLFALNNIPFITDGRKYSESAKPEYFDLFKTVNDSGRVEFLSFISSLIPTKIDKITIFYECDKDSNGGNCELSLGK